MINKIMTIEKAIDLIKDGDNVMYGGFGSGGFPGALVGELAKRDIKNIGIVSEDMGGSSEPAEALFEKTEMVRRLYTSYPRRNANVQKRYFAGDFDHVEIMPMGTFAERIRCGGAGIAAFLTRAGMGTHVQDGKEIMNVEGKDYMLETALHGNVALIYANRGDRLGNLQIDGWSKNFNVAMATACDTVIAQVFEIVEPGEIAPDDVTIPSVLVDAVVLTEESGYGNKVTRDIPTENREKICRRVLQEYNEGELINLGAGMPQESPDFMDGSKVVFFQNEGGVIGIGTDAPEDRVLSDFTDARGKGVTDMPGGMWFDSVYSFALMRSGHLDKTVLGGLEVDQEGSLSNWIIPGKICFGMGGAMDLVAGAKKVIVTMEHCTKKGGPKILKKCKLPITAYQGVDMIITERAVFDVIRGKGLILKEIAPGYTVDDIRACTEADFEVSPDLKTIEY